MTTNQQETMAGFMQDHLPEIDVQEALHLRTKITGAGVHIVQMLKGQIDPMRGCFAGVNLDPYNASADELGDACEAVGASVDDVDMLATARIMMNAADDEGAAELRGLIDGWFAAEGAADAH